MGSEEIGERSRESGNGRGHSDDRGCGRVVRVGALRRASIVARGAGSEAIGGCFAADPRGGGPRVGESSVEIDGLRGGDPWGARRRSGSAQGRSGTTQAWPRGHSPRSGSAKQTQGCEKTAAGRAGGRTAGRAQRRSGVAGWRSRGGWVEIGDSGSGSGGWLTREPRVVDSSSGAGPLDARGRCSTSRD